MLSIGIDAVEISRFNSWQHYKTYQLNHIFTQSEIDYCLSISAKSAERFASRFAAKEAFYKAISQCIDLDISTFKLFSEIEIFKNKNMTPEIKINNLYLQNLMASRHLTTRLSLTHTKTIACGVVVLM